MCKCCTNNEICPNPSNTGNTISPTSPVLFETFAFHTLVVNVRILGVNLRTRTIPIVNNHDDFYRFRIIIVYGVTAAYPQWRSGNTPWCWPGISPCTFPPVSRWPMSLRRSRPPPPPSSWTAPPRPPTSSTCCWRVWPSVPTPRRRPTTAWTWPEPTRQRRRSTCPTDLV